MEEKHIQFEDWEPDDLLDSAHLAKCEACQKGLGRALFLARMSEAAPEPEIPPFFASRAAKLAASSAISFWEVLDQMARRLVAALASLVLITSFLLYSTSEEPEVDGDTSIAWLMEEEQSGPVTLDDMLMMLAQAEWEEEGEDAEQY